MILFMINKDLPDSGVYKIPTVYSKSDPAITERNVRFISWNEAEYTTKEGKKIEIHSVSDLKQAVFDVAKHDIICKDINKQFKDQYKFDIFDASGTSFAI